MIGSTVFDAVPTIAGVTVASSEIDDCNDAGSEYQ